ncbi:MULTISPECIES: hypothetical protein [unclassified Streptomyces]|uniref:hypothetical protein n=1 Tax=unclassified Streptomyces TaxID=2593676 RepID=UPI0038110509
MSLIDRILISPGGYAHLPRSCVHYVDDLRAAGWGWINEPDPLYWDRIAADNPAPATNGNLGLTADRRCTHCENAFRAV